MNASTSRRKSLAAAALLAATGLAQANITVYTKQIDFAFAVGRDFATDTFEDLPTLSEVAGPLNRTAGAFSYTATEGPGSPSLFTAGPHNVWLSTFDPLDSITFSNFGGGVGAIGGRFFGTASDGRFDRGESVLVSAVDADGTVSRTIVDAKRVSFLGFVSDGAIVSLTVSALQPGGRGNVWPAVNNLVLAAMVPEPQTYALLLAGLAGMGVLMRRRRDEAG